MAVQVYALNVDAIRQDAQQAREYERRRKEENELRFGDFVEGDNVLRLLPPTNSRGILWKLVSKHYFNDTYLRAIDPQTCIASMFPEVAGVHCPICAVGDKLRAQFPQLDISRWHKPGSSYYVQALDRKDATQPNLAKLYRLTPSLKNWLSIQLEALAADGIDPVGLDGGVDIKITKTIKQTRKGSRANYTATIWSPKGVTPLHENPEVVQSILESMVNPDEIWKFPDDGIKSEIMKIANDILQFYLRSSMSSQSSIPPVPQMPYQTSAPQGPLPSEIAQRIAATVPQVPSTPTQLPSQILPTSTQLPLQVPPIQPSAQAPVQPTLPVQMSPQGVPPVQSQLPQIPSQDSVAQSPGHATQIPVQAPRSPVDKPTCFAGAGPRADGGVGYDPGTAECLNCPVEMACLDACQSKGK